MPEFRVTKAEVEKMKSGMFDMIECIDTYALWSMMASGNIIIKRNEPETGDIVYTWDELENSISDDSPCIPISLDNG